MNEEQKQAARERMAKARAVRATNMLRKKTNSVIDHIQTHQALLESSELKLPSVSVDSAPDLVLTVRRIHVGSFAGLWELGRVMPDGSIKILTDANTKALVTNLARNEILKLG